MFYQIIAIYFLKVTLEVFTRVKLKEMLKYPSSKNECSDVGDLIFSSMILQIDALNYKIYEKTHCFSLKNKFINKTETLWHDFWCYRITCVTSGQYH